MSSRISQSVIVQMKEATPRPIGVVDSAGMVVASSDLALIGSHIISAENIAAAGESAAPYTAAGLSAP